MKKLALLALTGLMSVTASASNWVQIDSTDTHTVYIDTDSISNSRGYKQLFMRASYYDVQILKNGKRSDELVSLTQVDCNSQPPRIRALSLLDRLNNKVVMSSNFVGSWLFVYPDSLADILVKNVCP